MLFVFRKTLRKQEERGPDEGVFGSATGPDEGVFGPDEGVHAPRVDLRPRWRRCRSTATTATTTATAAAIVAAIAAAVTSTSSTCRLALYRPRPGFSPGGRSAQPSLLGP